MKRSSGTESILRTALAVGAVTFAAGALAGCGGRTVVVHEPAPIEQPVAEAEVESDVVEESVVVGEAPVEPGMEEGTVVERVVEVERREPRDPVLHIHVGTGGGHGRRHGDHSRDHGLRGVAVVNFNTGYLDGWAGADFFNRGQPLSEPQIDRMLEVGRRQGDPTGKLALVGYQEGYRSGARREHNPYARRMTPEQSARYHTLRGTTPDAGRDGKAKGETPVATESRESEAARKARLEASKNNLEAARANRDAAQAAREAEAKRLETARLEKEAARKAELEANRDQREQRNLALKAKLEAEKKQRETEREQREVALKAKIEADRKAREEQAKAAKDKREEKRDQRHAALDKRAAERKQRLAEKKAEREAKKTETADTAEPTR